MNLQHLQYFRTVAETGQVTKAAKKLHISQPALSMALSTLESELEIPLFEKNGRLLHLTRGGKMFLEHVSKALDELDAGRHELARLSKSHERIIRIASTYSLSISLIPSLVKNFTVQYPDTIFHLKQGPNLEILENLANDDTDFVFGRIIPNEAKIGRAHV